MSAEIVIVTATYDRPDALKCAIESVIAQTFENWEYWVIGDCCAESTVRLMQDYCARDERVNFINREVNHGEQSIPNNEGVAQSSAPYIAFLNHDDLWFPDHLEKAYKHLVKRSADLVWAPSFLFNNDHVTARPLPTQEVFSPASKSRVSQWLLKRSLWQSNGPFTSAFEIRDTPSMDWIIRASKSKAKLIHTHTFTVIAFPSFVIENSYLKPAEGQQQALEKMLNLAGYRELLLHRVAVLYAKQLYQPSIGPAFRRAMVARLSGANNHHNFTRVLANRARLLLAKIGVSDVFLFQPKAWMRRGGVIDKLRQKRGLPPLDRGES